MRAFPAWVIVLAAFAAQGQGPDAEWRTLTTQHFRIHYPLEYEAWAKRAALGPGGIRHGAGGTHHRIGPAEQLDSRSDPSPVGHQRPASDLRANRFRSAIHGHVDGLPGRLGISRMARAAERPGCASPSVGAPDRASTPRLRSGLRRSVRRIGRAPLRPLHFGIDRARHGADEARDAPGRRTVAGDKA